MLPKLTCLLQNGSSTQYNGQGASFFTPYRPRPAYILRTSHSHKKVWKKYSHCQSIWSISHLYLCVQHLGAYLLHPLIFCILSLLNSFVTCYTVVVAHTSPILASIKRIGLSKIREWPARNYFYSLFQRQLHTNKNKMGAEHGSRQGSHLDRQNSTTYLESFLRRSFICSFFLERSSLMLRQAAVC